MPLIKSIFEKIKNELNQFERVYELSNDDKLKLDDMIRVWVNILII